MTDVFRFCTALFDVDGTLIDSNDAHAQSWTRALQEHGVPAQEAQIRRLIGMGADKLLPAAAQISAESPFGKAIARRKKEIFDLLLPRLQPTPGGRPLLEWLRERDVDLVIATSADEREMEALLQRAGVDDLIPRRTSKDDAAQSKPDPDIVRAALAQSEARPEVSVLIGDTPYDIEAAHRAGIAVIALRCGGYWTDDELQGALEIIDHPAALLHHWQGVYTSVAPCSHD
jgi:HAD superfamily hydrolase (TIGR01509 family)